MSKQVTVVGQQISADVVKIRNGYYLKQVFRGQSIYKAKNGNYRRPPKQVEVYTDIDSLPWSLKKQRQAIAEYEYKIEKELHEHLTKLKNGYAQPVPKHEENEPSK